MPRNLSRDPEPEIPSNTVTWFFREAFRRLWASKRTSFVAIAMIAISLLILGFFLLVAENLQRAAREWQGRSRVTIFFVAEATPEQVAAVQQLLSKRPQLADRRFVSREEANERFKREFPALAEVVSQLGENPFPASIEMDVDPKLVRMPQFTKEMRDIGASPGVDEISFDWEWVERLERVVEIVTLVGFIAGGILAIAAAFTIANVIRLTMMLYREEIEIMRLVGATESMIRGPFIIEGILQGLIGAGVAIGVLFGAYTAARNNLSGASSVFWSFLFQSFLPWRTLSMLLAGGLVAGWLGSWLSVRERVQEEA